MIDYFFGRGAWPTVETSRPELVTAPAELPVSLGEVKRDARAVSDDDDAELAAFLGAAVVELDGYHGILGRCIMAQTWRQGFSRWARELLLPFPDVSSATVAYYDEAGAKQTVDGSSFTIERLDVGDVVRFADGFAFPTLETARRFPVEIEVTAGADKPSEVSEVIRLAVRGLAVHWFDGRDGYPPQVALAEKLRWVTP